MSKQEHLTSFYCYALSNNNYSVFAVKMVSTYLLTNVNLSCYFTGLLSGYILYLQNLIGLKTEFGFLMSEIMGSNFLLSLNWYANKIMSKHNKRLFLTSRWWHYDLYSIYANLFRVGLDVTNMSLLLSKLFEKRIINFAFNAKKFHLGLYEINLNHIYHATKQFPMNSIKFDSKRLTGSLYSNQKPIHRPVIKNDY
jgi:hypothetical protein